MVKRFKAAVYGGSGYGGAELIRRLLLHPDVELARVASVDFVGKPLGAAHPNLDSMTDLRFEQLTPEETAKDCHVVLMALPHKVTAHQVPAFLDSDVKLVDMSGDFRLSDVAAYQRYYGAKHPRPDLIERFVYGAPEINRAKIAKADYVASPGCFATSVNLALLPLARGGLLTGIAHVTGVTGSSGSGAGPSLGTHHPSRAQNLKTYKPLAHQHSPEIVEALTGAGGRDWQLAFNPVSAPLTRGIFTTAYLDVAASVDVAQIEKLFNESYAKEPFVRRPLQRLPEVVAVSGSNYAEVGFALGEPASGKRTVACFAALDNLIKGGAGQAIQSMNLMLGLDEKTSLEDPGSWP